ncbi:MAG: hypothetical protein MI923_15360 [Phycisphaerales bacterium]|nr:hypothetical protein [Phycisphaerales bacterium]
MLIMIRLPMDAYVKMTRGFREAVRQSMRDGRCHGRLRAQTHAELSRPLIRWDSPAGRKYFTMIPEAPAARNLRVS